MKNTSIKFQLLLFLFIGFTSIYGQQTKTIKNSFIIQGQNISAADLSFYTASIEAADFEQFRLQTETVLIKFKNGFNLELISAKDLVIRNIKADLDINSYSNYPSTPNYKYPLFEVLSSGWVIGAVETLNK